MSDSGRKTPLHPPITPPVRKKAPFSGFRSPKYALLTPLFPPNPPENRPFCAHFRALGFGQIALTIPPRRLSPVTRQWSAVTETPSPPAPLPQRGEGRVSLDFACPLRGERVPRLAGAGEGSFVGADFKPARGSLVTQLPLSEVAALQVLPREKPQD